MALLDETLRDEIQVVADNVHLLELAGDSEFAEEFILQTSFPSR